MANKPSWVGHEKDYERMLKGNGFKRERTKGSHGIWKDKNGRIITIGTIKGHLRDELAWNVIRKFDLEWERYV